VWNKDGAEPEPAKCRSKRAESEP